MMVSFALEKLFDVMRSNLSITDFSACFSSVLFIKSSPVPNEFKAIPYSFFYQVQWILFYVKTFLSLLELRIGQSDKDACI